MPSGIYPRKIRSKKYPLSFRNNALELYKCGSTFSEIAKKLGTSPTVIHYWVKQLEPTILTKGKYWLGKKRGPRSESTKKKIGDAHRGEKSVGWIKDRTKLQKYGDENKDRRSSAYRDWRKNVWLRDNFTCKMSNSDCCGRIEAHHILGYSEYPELRYAVNNGITVCRFHHPRKRMEEKALIPTFQELVLLTINK